MIARRDLSVLLLARRDLSPTCFQLELACDQGFEAKPGQFGMLSCGPGLDPLLRRPFSLAGVRREGTGSVVELLIKEVGKGTSLLRGLPDGAALRLVAPLGRGFSLTGAGQQPLALLAGGIGLPPVLFAAEVLAQRGQQFDLYFGAATAAELIVLDRCRRAVEMVTGEVILTTDDGSAGERTVVTRALARRLEVGMRYARVLACGPKAMLAAVTELAREHQLAAELSLEEPMACGVGVCLGCVVELADGRRAPSCQEGPVLAVDRLAPRWWE